MTVNGGRERNDSALIAALASGKTYKEAARIARVSERTVERRMGEQEFRASVARARDRIVERALGRATDSMTEAITTLTTLMRSSASDSVKLRAARTILEFGGGRHPLTEAVSRTFMMDTTEASRLVTLIVDTAFDYVPVEAQRHFIERVRASAR